MRHKRKKIVTAIAEEIDEKMINNYVYRILMRE